MSIQTVRRLLRDADLAEDEPKVEQLFDELIELVDDLQRDQQILLKNIEDLVREVERLDGRVQTVESELDSDES